MSKGIVLASSSVHRRELLKNAGIDFTAESSDLDERAIEAPLLDKSDYGATSTPQKRSKGAPAAPDRFWTDIAICCGSLVLIVAVFNYLVAAKHLPSEAKTA